ncbi:MAG TPA: hypothetical protein VIS03_10590 [Kiloniellaceae bacterium]
MGRLSGGSVGDMALFWRIWAAVTLVNLAVLTIFVGLATLQFGNINSDLVGERLVVLADLTAAPFEAAAKIGLPLSTVRNADALLERARQTDGAILAIHVFDAAGRIVHSTAEPAPAAISAETLAVRRASEGVAWHRETSEGFLSSIDIASRTGQSAGGILIVYPKAGSLIQVRAMAAELTLAAIAVLLISAAFSALLLRLGLQRQIKLFETFDAAIVDFERDTWRGAAGRPVVPAEDDDGGDLHGLLATSERRYISAGRSLAAARNRAP